MYNMMDFNKNHNKQIEIEAIAEQWVNIVLAQIKEGKNKTVFKAKMCEIKIKTL